MLLTVAFKAQNVLVKFGRVFKSTMFHFPDHIVTICQKSYKYFTRIVNYNPTRSFMG